MHNFTPPCLNTTLSLADLGLTAIGQHRAKRHLTVLCLITDGGASCPECQQWGRTRSTRSRELVHPPIGLSAVTLAIRIHTFVGPDCQQRWSQSPAKACVQTAFRSRTRTHPVAARSRFGVCAFRRSTTGSPDRPTFQLRSETRRMERTVQSLFSPHCWFVTSWA